MRSRLQADYGVGVPIALAPLDRERLLTEIPEDERALLTPQPADGMVVAPLPRETLIAQITPIIPPIPTLTPTPTATPTPAPTLAPTSPPAEDTPDSTASAEPATPAPATPAPTTPAPSPTALTPTPTVPSPSPTVIIVSPTATSPPSTATPEPPTPTSPPSPTPTSPPSPTPTTPPTPTPLPTSTPPTNRPPIARDDPSVVTNEDVATTTIVLANDTDPDGDPLEVVSVTKPISGVRRINSDYTITYTPTLDFYGLDIFTYTISDGSLTDTARITVTVNSVNDRPVAQDVSVNTSSSSTETIVIIPDFATDKEGPLTIVAVGTPMSGTVSYDTSVIAYTPTVNVNGTDIFTYTVSDGELSDTATISVQIIASVNNPPVANDDSYTTNNLLLFVPAPGVLMNDSDPENNPLTATLVTTPTQGSLTLGSNGSFTYTTTVTGSYSFTYQAHDGVSFSNIATVILDIGP